MTIRFNKLSCAKQSIGRASHQARRRTMKEMAMSPTTGTPFSMGQGFLAGASAIGLGGLMFYGLGFSNEVGAAEKAMIWPVILLLVPTSLIHSRHPPSPSKLLACWHIMRASWEYLWRYTFWFLSAAQAKNPSPRSSSNCYFVQMKTFEKWSILHKELIWIPLSRTDLVDLMTHRSPPRKNDVEEL